MAEVMRSESPEGSTVSSELTHSIITSDDCSQSIGDDFEDQLSAAELNELCKESVLPLDELLSIYGSHLQSTIPSSTLDSQAPGTGILFETLSPSSSEDDNDEEYLPENDSSRHQNVPVGENHQAVIPELLHRHKNSLANNSDEHLLWDPSRLLESKVEKYCFDVARHSCLHSTKVANVHKSCCHVIQDDEQALYLLLQCNYDVHEALRRHEMQVIPPTDPLSLWSDEERANFVAGLKLYGKDFYLIQQHKVRTRSVGELVHVYYLWKKTDQYAAFTGKPYNFRRQSQPQLLPRTSSYDDVNTSRSHLDPIINNSADWTANNSGELDSTYMDHYLPMMPSWLSAHGCDAMLDHGKLDPAVYYHDMPQCGLQYQPSTYVDSFHQDQYYFPQFCVDCRHVNSSKTYTPSATDSPVIGRGISGELPAAARAALYFPSSSVKDSDPYVLLTRTSNNVPSGHPGVHGYSTGEMLAQ